ncbi:MAG: alpha/beta fold hydrolase [Bdellovibrionales bacterium]
MRKYPHSKATNDEWVYPLSECTGSGVIQTQDNPPLAQPHTIAWKEYGNPKGEPIIYLHGGPGDSVTDAPNLSRFFNPKRYRIIMYDQRGGGANTPNARDADPMPAYINNTTDHLIADIILLRQERGITGKTHIFGGSWGTTLALAYAIKHPDTVANLILRGIFLCRRKDLDYFYQGNAALYEKSPYDSSLPGAYLFYPEAWKNFVEIIPPAERGDMIKAYARIFAEKPTTEAIRARRIEAAAAWSVWECATSYISQDLSNLANYANPDFALVFAGIENHYFMNGGFLGGGGESNRDNNYICDNVAALRNIPMHIVHGRYDQVCPAYMADELVAAMAREGFAPTTFHRTPCGHAMKERETLLALTDILDNLPPMSEDSQRAA